MACNPDIIKYSYKNERSGPRAVGHVFRYISALTGIIFKPDCSEPDIYSGSENAPDSARVILGNSKGRSPDDSRGSGTDRVILKNDPVGEILKRISPETIIGPFAAKEPAAYPDDSTISGLIGGFMKAMIQTGLVPAGARSIDIWPGNRRFGAVLTHDIDITRRSIHGSLRLLFEKSPPGRARGLWDALKWAAGRGSNPYDRIGAWIEIEKDLGVVSTFFAYAGPRNHPDDPKYNIGDLADSLGRVSGYGFEVALHTGINSYEGRFIDQSKNTLEGAAKMKVTGARPHYLSASLPSYWHKAVESGMLYTSCLGFDDRAGYYDGIDLPFVPFDKSIDAPIDIIEIPIAIMDCGLIGGDADSDETARRGKAIIDKAAASGGLVVLDWHQRTLYEPDYPGWGKLFLKLLHYMIEKEAYIGRMDAVAALLRGRLAEL